MAQSYGTLTDTNIAVPTDSILGINIQEQLLGTSISAVTGEAIPTALTLMLSVDGSTSQTITVQGNTPMDVANSIQVAIQALAVNPGFVGFTARYDIGLSQYILTSGTAGTASSSVVVSGGTAAPVIHLGVTNGGSESYTGSEVIVYTVYYQFVFNAGQYYSSAPVKVLSSDIATPASITEMLVLANERAAQIKEGQQSSLYPYVFSDNETHNGPVSLPLH